MSLFNERLKVLNNLRNKVRFYLPNETKVSATTNKIYDMYPELFVTAMTPLKGDEVPVYLWNHTKPLGMIQKFSNVDYDDNTYETIRNLFGLPLNKNEYTHKLLRKDNSSKVLMYRPLKINRGLKVEYKMFFNEWKGHKFIENCWNQYEKYRLKLSDIDFVNALNNSINYYKMTKGDDTLYILYIGNKLSNKNGARRHISDIITNNYINDINPIYNSDFLITDGRMCLPLSVKLLDNVETNIFSGTGVKELLTLDNDVMYFHGFSDDFKSKLKELVTNNTTTPKGYSTDNEDLKCTLCQIINYYYGKGSVLCCVDTTLTNTKSWIIDDKFLNEIHPNNCEIISNEFYKSRKDKNVSKGYKVKIRTKNNNIYTVAIRQDNGPDSAFKIKISCKYDI